MGWRGSGTRLGVEAGAEPALLAGVGGGWWVAGLVGGLVDGLGPESGSWPGELSWLHVGGGGCVASAARANANMEQRWRCGRCKDLEIGRGSSNVSNHWCRDFDLDRKRRR